MNFCLVHLLNSIKNGQKAKKAYILLRKTTSQIIILNQLWKEGFILGYKFIFLKEKQVYIKIFLKYYSFNLKPAINFVKIFSKPGGKKYCSVKDLWKLNSFLGTLYLSTNKGILNLSDCKKHNLGGKLLFLVK